MGRLAGVWCRVVCRSSSRNCRPSLLWTRVVCFLWICSCPLAAAQYNWNVSTADLAGINNTRNLTETCELLKKEALEACMEYEQMGLTPLSCKPWQMLAERVCYNTGGNCTTLGEEIREQCRFQLQFAVVNPTLRLNYCVSTENQFRDFRCPPASYAPLNSTWCETQEADDCMQECGNYRGCYCRKQRGSFNPDKCDGETLITSYLPFIFESVSQSWVPIGNYSCNTLGQPPPNCRHHEIEGKCGLYKHCEPDMCIIKNVSCPNRTQCEAAGICEPKEGLCSYSNRPDGYNCSDGLFYTLGDQCFDGVCMGTTDYCLKYNTTCIPQSVCLYGGVCNPNSGRCVYDKVLDGTDCDDGREYTVEDRCNQGICIGKVVNLCIERGVVCRPPNECYDPGVCDPLTGICSDAIPTEENRPCDDGNPHTHNSSCVDGICLGEPAGIRYEFVTLIGKGKCTDRDGRETPRYIGDVPEGEEACQKVCKDDVQCLAYGYAFPLCSIYGTVRTKPPRDGRPWAFQLGTDPAAVAVEQTSPPVLGQRATVCRKKGLVPDVLEADAQHVVLHEDWFGFVQVFSVSMASVLLFLCWPILRCAAAFLCPSRFAQKPTQLEIMEDENRPPAPPKVNRKKRLSRREQLRQAALAQEAAAREDSDDDDNDAPRQPAAALPARAQAPPRALPGPDDPPPPPVGDPPEPPHVIGGDENNNNNAQAG